MRGITSHGLEKSEISDEYFKIKHGMFFQFSSYLGYLKAYKMEQETSNIVIHFKLLMILLSLYFQCHIAHLLRLLSRNFDWAKIMI